MLTRSLTRRDFSASLAAMLPAVAAVRALRWQDDGIIRDAEAIHQEAKFTAAPKRVYAALLDAGQFSKMTGGQPAEIDPKPGGAFSLFGARIEGCNVALVQDQLIVQAWRSKAWAAGIYSITRFDLQPDGTGTKLVFDQAGFPKGEAQHLAAGWRLNYWGLLAKYLG